MSKTIWIDMTDMASWSGQHGGTQRVVYGIAEEYYKQDEADEVRFFVFKPSNHKFYAYDFNIIRMRVAAMADAAANSNQAVSKQAVLKEKIIKYVPNTLIANDRFRKSGKKVLKASFVLVKKTRTSMRSIKSRMVVAHNSAKEVTFAKGDVVFLPGKPWDNPELLPTLADLKQEVGFKIAAVVYDMVIPLYPHLHSKLLFNTYTQFAYELAQAADILFPISQSSANDFEVFCKKLSLPCPRQHVIRIGDKLENVKKPTKPAVPIAKKFLLCVGTIEVRKNHMLLYYTYKLAQERSIDLPQLIIVGRPGWNAEDTYKLLTNDQTLREKIMIMQSISDPELTWLYQNCLFTVYPSMYEGWGLPVAESIQYGKVAVASHASSIPEIAGDLLEYFSPYSSEECMQKINKLLDDDRRVTMERLLSKKYRTTTWQGAYDEIVAVLGNV